MEAIRSGEKVARPTLEAGNRPIHVHEDHRACAFYLTETREMVCQHGFAAEGAFYNEDLIWAIREPSHSIIDKLDSLLAEHNVTRTEEFYQHDQQMRIQFQYDAWLRIDPEELWHFRHLRDELRELTK